MPLSTSERYKRDPAFRELHKKRVRLAYWRKRKPRERPSPEVLRTDLNAQIVLPNGRTVRVPIYRVGNVAQILGVSTQTVRLWEKRGTLPEPTIIIEGEDRNSRGYTYDQVRLIYDLLPLLNFSDSRDDPPPKPKRKAFSDEEEYKKAVEEYEKAMAAHRYDHNPFSRELKRRWAKLVYGIRPETYEQLMAEGEGA